jgi:micrococcal nuclease
MKQSSFKFRKKDTYRIIQFLIFVGFMITLAVNPQAFNLAPTTKDLPAPVVAPVVLPPAAQDLVAVTKVVDGDTIEVSLAGENKKVRLIGINTPETVDPRKPVECFGKEASARAKELLTGKNVRLQADSSQTNTDKYGRLLRYVFLEDGTDFNLKMVQDGFAYEYTYDVPYQFQTEFKKAQADTEKAGLGLWSQNTCAGKK